MNQASKKGFVRNADVSTATVLVAADAALWYSLKSVVIVQADAAALVDVVDDDGAVVWPAAPFPASGGIVRDNLTMQLFRTGLKGKGLKVKSSTAGLVTCVVEVYSNPA